MINKQSENIFQEKYTSHIHGRIFPESMSKPRFIAVHNDDIYIADLGLIFSIEVLCLFIFFS